MIEIEYLHHVSVPVSNLERAKRFYEGILGLMETGTRPAFDFPGAWYHLGNRQLHLIVDERGTSTFRKGKRVDSRDAHFALRVKDYEATLEYLKEKGYHTDEAGELTGDDRLMEVRVSRDNPTPWQQLYIMDPDWNVIELNVDRPER